MPTKLFNKLIKSKGLMQSAMVAVGNVGASGFSAISLIILSRFLGPEQFGAFSVAFALSQLVSRLADAGLGIGTQRIVAASYVNEPEKAAVTVRYVGTIKLVIAALSVVIGLAFGKIVGTKVFNLTDPSIATLGIVLASVIVLYDFVLVVLQSVSKFAASVSVNATQAIIKCVMAFVSLWVLVPSAYVSYLWYGLAPLAALVVGWLLVPKFLKQSSNNFDHIKKPLFDTVRFSSIAVFSAAISDNIDVLMVKSWLTEYETGLYSAAVRVSLMVTLIGLSFGTVFNTRVAQYKNEHHLTKFLEKAMPFALISLLGIPVSILLAKPMILFTAGEQFLGAVNSMNMLMAGAFVTMAMMPYVAVFYAVEYPIYFAVSGVVQAIVLIIANFILIPRYGIEGAAAAKLITRVIILAYTIVTAVYIARKQYQAKAPGVLDIKKWIRHAVST